MIGWRQSWARAINAREWLHTRSICRAVDEDVRRKVLNSLNRKEKREIRKWLNLMTINVQPVEK